MNTSEHIQSQHLSRQALVYIRQSSPNQVLKHQESLELQYGLRDRAANCGWHSKQIRVIDSDLGISATTATSRPGFQELVALVSLGQVGIIFAYDVTRLARNCTDWYQLLDLCGARQCLVGDQDAVYDPATPNGRLILGLKGLIAELELHTIRARMMAGLLNKAKRGDLALTLPTGLVRQPSGQVVKHPDREVQSRLELVFTTFQRVHSATQTVRYLNEQQLRLPRRDTNHDNDIVWRLPTTTAVISILKNPAYAGTFAYGRTQVMPTSQALRQRSSRRMPQAEWRTIVHDKYPAYIDWATFEKNQAMLRDNRSEYENTHTRGVPRFGKALLHGLVYCGDCGHKMLVQYSRKTRYACNFLRRKQQGPLCQFLQADPIDAAVVSAFFEALSPMELDLYEQALAATDREQEQVRRAHHQQLERLRYQARLAERQYQKSDPDNRLVTAELEKRWEIALQNVQQAEQDWQQIQVKQAPAVPISPALRATFSDVARGIPELWQHVDFTLERKKALLRCMIDKVVTRRSAPDTIHVRIVWRGGDTTEFEVPVAVASIARLSCGQKIEQMALDLINQGQSDEQVAAELTRRGFRSPREMTVVPTTIRTIRLKHRILRPRSGSRPRRVPGKLTVPQIAKLLDVPVHWMYKHIQRGNIQAPHDPVKKLYLFPDSPEILAQLKKLKAGQIQSVRI